MHSTLVVPSDLKDGINLNICKVSKYRGSCICHDSKSMLVQSMRQQCNRRLVALVTSNLSRAAKPADDQLGPRSAMSKSLSIICRLTALYKEVQC